MITSPTNRFNRHAYSAFNLRSGNASQRHALSTARVDAGCNSMPVTREVSLDILEQSYESGIEAC